MFFKRVLPGLGWLFTLGAVGLQLFWEKQAADLTNHDDAKGQALTAAWTTSSGVVTILIFVGTQTHTKLALAGEKIDNKIASFFKKNVGERQPLVINEQIIEAPAPVNTSISSCRKICNSLALGTTSAVLLGVGSMDTWDTMNNVYQEIRGLINDGGGSEYDINTLEKILHATVVTVGVSQSIQDLSVIYSVINAIRAQLNKNCLASPNPSTLIEEGVMNSAQYQSVINPPPRLRQLLLQAEIKQIDKQIHIVFTDSEEAKNFIDILFQNGIENRGMKGAKRKLSQYMEGNLEKYSIPLTIEEFEKLLKTNGIVLNQLLKSEQTSNHSNLPILNKQG